MAEKKVVGWFTSKGKHIPIFEGESKQDALNRAIAKENEEKKQQQISQNKEQADKLNGKVTAKKPMSMEDIQNSKVRGKSMSESEKKQVIADLKKQAEELKGLSKVKVLNRISMIEEGWEGTPEEYYNYKKEEREKAYQKDIAEKRAKEEAKRQKEEQAKKQLEEEMQTQPKHKVSQFKIIQKYNPMLDDYHVGIRKPSDIKTWEEVLDEDKADGESFSWGDFSRKDAETALKRGAIYIYSSYPIKQGVFVSTSKAQAEQYAGGKGNAVYSKKVLLEDVAWINGDEGQYAKLKR